MNDQSFGKKAAAGMFWSVTELVVRQGIQFVIQILLARLLLPEEFGIVGMVAIFIAVSQTLVNSGFSNALIREEAVDDDTYSTVFHFNFAVSLLIYLALLLGRSSISRFFDEPVLAQILPVLGLVIILNALSIVQRTRLTRAVDFKTQARISAVASICSGILAVSLALAGLGVWSLVIRTVAYQLLHMVLLIAFGRWLPKLVFDKAVFVRLFGFSWKLLLSSLIDTAYKNIYYVIIGRYFSAQSLGYYSNGRKLRDTVSVSMTSSIQRVTYPVLSRIKEDESQLKDGYKKIIRMTVFFFFPVMAGLGAVASIMIPLLLGDHWSGSIPYFQLLCLNGLLYPLHALNLNMLQVKGRSDLFLRLEIIKKTIGILSIVIVLALGFGILELLWVSVLNSVIAYGINSYYSSRLLDYAIVEQLKDIAPTSAVTSMMVLAVTGILMLVGKANAIGLITAIAVGATVYIVLSVLFRVEALKEVRQWMTSMLPNVLCQRWKRISKK